MSVEPIQNLSVEALYPDAGQGHEKENISILIEPSPTKDREKKGSSGSRPSSPQSCTSGRAGASTGAPNGAGGGEALRPLGQIPSVQSFDGIPMPAEAIHAKMTELGGKRWADLTDDESPVIPSPSDLRSPSKRAPSISLQQQQTGGEDDHEKGASKTIPSASVSAAYHPQEHLDAKDTDGEEGGNKEDDEWTPPTREQSTVHEDFPATPPVGKPAPPPTVGSAPTSGVYKPSPRNRSLPSGSTSTENSPEIRPKPATAPLSVGEEIKPKAAYGAPTGGGSCSVSPGVYPKVPYSTPATSPGLNPSMRSPPSALVAPTPLGDDTDSGFMLPPSALPLSAPASSTYGGVTASAQNPPNRPSWQNRTPPSHPQRSPQALPATTPEGQVGKTAQQGSAHSSSHTTPKWRPSPKATPTPSPNVSFASRTSPPPPAQPSWLQGHNQTQPPSRKEEEDGRPAVDPSELTVHIRTIPTRHHPGTLSPNPPPLPAPSQPDPKQTWNNTNFPVSPPGYRPVSPPPASTGVVTHDGTKKTSTHNDPYASQALTLAPEFYLPTDTQGSSTIATTGPLHLASHVGAGPGTVTSMPQPMLTHAVNPISGRPMRHSRGGGFAGYRRPVSESTPTTAGVALNTDQYVDVLISRSVHGALLRRRLSFHPYNADYWQAVLPTAHSHNPPGSSAPTATVGHPKGSDSGIGASATATPSDLQSTFQMEALPVVRLFVGHWWKQLPYSILQWLVETFVPEQVYNSHCVMFNPQPHCDKQNRFKGCLHVNLCTSNPKAVVDTLHHRVLFDVEGAWFASNPEDRRFLEDYCAGIRATPESCRFGQLRTLPPNPIAFEFAKNL